MPVFNAGAMENPGLITYQQSILVTKPGEMTRDRQRRYAEHRRPRAGPPVVRQPGHHAVLGRHLAERGVRHLDGRQGHDPLEARVGRRRGPGELAFAGDGPGQPGQRPDDPPAHRDRRRHRQRVRRHHLQQGRGGAAHVRALDRRGHVPRRRARLPGQTRLGQRRVRGLRRRHLRRRGQGRAPGVRQLRHPDRRAAGQLRARLRRRPAAGAAPRPAALPAAGLQPARRPAVADPGLRPLRHGHPRRGPGLHPADPGPGRPAAGRRPHAARSGCSPTRRPTATTGRCPGASCWTGCWPDRPRCCRCPNASACWATPTPWCPAATSAPSRRWRWWSGWPATPRTGWWRRRWPSWSGSTTWCRRRCGRATSGSSSRRSARAPASWAGAAARARTTTSRSCARICWGWWPSEGNDRALAAEARTLVERWLQDRSAIEPELVSTALGVAAYHGDAALFDKLYAAARATRAGGKGGDRQERSRLLGDAGGVPRSGAGRADAGHRAVGGVRAARGDGAAAGAVSPARDPGPRPRLLEGPLRPDRRQAARGHARRARCGRWSRCATSSTARTSRASTAPG